MTGDGPRLNRRAMLAGLAAASATPVLANAPERSVFPQPRLARPDGSARLTARPLEALLAQAQLGGTTGFVALDAADGSIIEALNADTPLPPASVAKAPTALYALDRLGAGYRFTTHVLATGNLADGTLRGDLILQGGGDPTLQTADLAALAQALVRRGLRRITGPFLTDDSALPFIREIAADQPPQAGYN
ncbi:MAG: D-alanyl-D-alanine carboxypeptidase, partial [Pararhodobacter sp.]|nr:D-alanyl-D-alanine carboxypeptidase [Pararhodobacter sp.]